MLDCHETERALLRCVVHGRIDFLLRDCVPLEFYEYLQATTRGAIVPEDGRL